MSPALQSLFELRSKSLFDANIISLGILPSICEALHKFDLFLYFWRVVSEFNFPNLHVLETECET